MKLFAYMVCAVLAAVLLLFWRSQRQLRREACIRHFVLPLGLFEKLRQQHPHLSQKDCQLVAQGLRQFFLAHLKSGRKFVSMPSQVADDLWHEFILHTRTYQQFCRVAFGDFMHHTPAVAIKQSRVGDEGIRRCWTYACQEENINPAKPTRLPLLFALDSKLGIANGYTYVAECSGPKRTASADANVYCGAELGVFAAACGGGSGCGGSDSSDAGGGDCSDGGGGDSGCGGGCGGGGCGGGGD
jgi:hypothetical protein